PTYQPEEPLKPLAGEEAFGEWTLEVWDNRVGAALTNGTLLSWRLGLTFVNTNPPVIPLTNGLPHTNMVGPGQIIYFVVQVPATAAHATNWLLSLTGGPLDLLYNQGALPSGRGRNDFFLLDDVTEGATDVSVLGSTEFDDQWMLIDSRALPRLRPGRRYYLGVRNTPPQPGVTNQFVLRVDFDHTDADLGNIVSLGNGGCASGTVVAGGTDYYQFDVLSNAVTVSLSLTNLGGDADLVARRYLPLPDLGFNDYGSFNGGTTNEFIRIEDFSYLLLPGRWYLGVVNRDATPVSYDLCASQFATDVICLTDQPYANSVAPGAVQYYKVDILPRSTEAYFWVTNLAAPEVVELYVANRLPFPPGPTNFCYLGTNLHAVSESVTVTSDTLPCPLLPGPWYLAVTNLTSTAQSYVVQVFQTNGLICLTNRIAYTDFVPAGGTNYYKFEVETNALQAEFELFGMATDLNLYVLAAPSAFTPRPGPTNFTYASTNQITTNEFVRVWDANTLDSTNLPAGDWFIAVVNTNAGGSPFSLRATQLRVPQEIVYLDDNVRRRNLGPTNAPPHSGFHYYAYRAASNAVQLRIDVFDLTTNVDLYVDKNLPVPGPARHRYRSTNGGLATETIILGTNSSPLPLSAGDWFFAVSNATAGIAGYSIQVTEITGDELRVLQNGLARCDTVAAPNGLPTVGTNLYLFTVSSNAAQVLFETLNANGNVDLFVTPGLPLGDASTFPLNSTAPGTTNEAIIVVTNGTPLALTPGVWGLAVINRDLAPVDYCVRATEIATNQIIRLIDGVTHTDTVPGASAISSLGADYFLFTVSGGPLQVNFETFAADGDVDLYVTKTFPLPALAAFPYASTNAGLANEFIAVTPASAPVALSDGDWYLAVVNREVAAVNYSVRATQIFPTQIITLTDGVAHGDSVDPASGAGSIDYYVFTVDAAALQADFVVYENAGDVDLYLRHGLPLPGENFFDYAGANPGATPEWISVNAASAPVALAAGDWYLAVVNRESAATPYTVRAYQTLAGDIVVLTNASPYTNTAVAAGADYYLFTVSNTSVRAQFEVLGPDGDVTLAVRRGLPLPSRTLFDYLSDAPGTNNERVLLFTNSTPPLAAGDWYLAVFNDTAMPATYAIRAMEFESTGTNLLVTGVTITSNAFCLSWTNALVGLTYLIEGKAAINDPIWLPAAPLVTATNTFMVYCIPLPSPFSFFRVREYLAPTNSVSAPQLTVTSGAGPLTNGFSFTWTAPTNLQFAVQWADAPDTNTWRFYPRRITSTNGLFQFTDDGSRTGGLGAQRFYRVLLAP
ncbi:MAG TPA: hypothetical protein VNO52_00185, partial [Methylomirabilota bacterium]|nr:hypothetical protein [Methylomirabilota bacterium]